jgi:hypothetical protein
MPAMEDGRDPAGNTGVVTLAYVRENVRHAAAQRGAACPETDGWS